MSLEYLLGQDGVHQHRTGRGEECWDKPLSYIGLVLAAAADKDNDDEQYCNMET